MKTSLTSLKNTDHLFAAPPHRYFSLYLKTLPIFAAFILLNCKFIVGRFSFTWNAASWYLTVCYLTFPMIHILFLTIKANRMKLRTPTPIIGGAVTPKALIYAAGLPLMPLRDYTGHENHILANFPYLMLEFLLAPLVLLIVTIFRH